MVHRSACLKGGSYWSAGDKLLGSQCLVNAPALVRKRESRDGSRAGPACKGENSRTELRGSMDIGMCLWLEPRMETTAT